MAELSVIEFGKAQHAQCEENSDFSEGRFWSAFLNGAYAQKSEDERIDAVPVVRCKDCVHKHAVSCESIVVCSCLGKTIQMKPSDFCSYGERKEGAEDG